MTISVLIADDQAMVRAGFRMILAAEPDLDVVGEAKDGEAAVRLAKETQPDVVIMDIRMPKLDGIEATRRLCTGADVAPKVLVLTTFDLEEYLDAALLAGASGFLLKEASPEQLLAAVRTVAAGDALLAPQMMRRLVERAVSASNTPPSPRLESLTPRELEVLTLVAQAKSNAEVATALFLGEATVKTHLSRVLTKLRLRDRLHAVVFAYENGVVKPGGSGEWA